MKFVAIWRSVEKLKERGIEFLRLPTERKRWQALRNSEPPN
jgi:biotin operon repressor